MRGSCFIVMGLGSWILCSLLSSKSSWSMETLNFSGTIAAEKAASSLPSAGSAQYLEPDDLPILREVLQQDVFAYYSLAKLYPTQLKQSIFEEGPEFKVYKKEIAGLREGVLKTVYCLGLYPQLSDYDLKRGGFIATIPKLNPIGEGSVSFPTLSLKGFDPQLFIKVEKSLAISLEDIKAERGKLALYFLFPIGQEQGKALIAPHVRVLLTDPQMSNVYADQTFYSSSKSLSKSDQRARTVLQSIGGATPRCTKTDLGGPTPAMTMSRLSMLSNGDSETRERAARALASYTSASKEVIPALVRALKDESYGVRWAAVKSLGEFGTSVEEGIPDLAGLLDGASDLGRAAAATLAAIGAPAIPHLTAALKSASWSTRDLAASTLGKIVPHALSALPDLEAAYISEEYDPPLQNIVTAMKAIRNAASGGAAGEGSGEVSSTQAKERRSRVLYANKNAKFVLEADGAFQQLGPGDNEFKGTYEINEYKIRFILTDGRHEDCRYTAVAIRCADEISRRTE